MLYDTDKINAGFYAQIIMKKVALQRPVGPTFFAIFSAIVETEL